MRPTRRNRRDAENLQKLLETTRAESLAKQQSASALRAERDTLSDELAGLKAEVEELTVSHDLEVERLQERLGQLQTVPDKLELSVSEKRKGHEKALLDMDMQEEQKMSQTARPGAAEARSSITPSLSTAGSAGCASRRGGQNQGILARCSVK